MNRASRTFAWLALLVVAAVLALGFVYRDGYDAVLLLADLSGVDTPLPDRRPAVARQEAAFAIGREQRPVHVYLPEGEVRAGLVLVPGAAEGGLEDARLVVFAVALARCGFAVVVPDIPALRELRLTSASVADVAAAFDYLAHGPETEPWLRPRTPLGIGAFSVASGLAALATLQPRLEGEVDFLLLVGGYHDLERTLGYLTTGQYRNSGQRLDARPDPYGKWVYALGNAALLGRRAERAALEEIARAQLADPAADTGEALGRLGPQGRAVYDFIQNTDPGRVPELILALPPKLRAEIDALNLAGRDLSGLPPRLILVHGLDDRIIPYGESLSLAMALPGSRAQVYLLEGLHHVDSDFHGRDAWRAWRALRALLALRD